MSILQIQEEVSKYYHVPLKDLKGKTVKTIVVPRQISMYLAREMTDNSLPKLVPNWRQRSYNGDSCARKDSAIIGKIQRFKRVSEIKIY